jgi:16S rRNA (adenine1518-N6/adenine1519-N6)-dimethyltransferase
MSVTTPDAPDPSRDALAPTTSAGAQAEVPSWEDPRRVLGRHGLAPKRSFSQNFLISESAVARIAEAVAPAPGELVVELGPGLGTLTGALLRAGASVVAIEQDRAMIAVLAAEFTTPRLRVREGDAATVDYAALGAELGVSRLAVAGNLPYAVTGGILRTLTLARAHLSRAVVMVQREVRDRLLALPGTSEYGALTVFVQGAFAVTPVVSVPPGAFHPAPKVASAVVKLVPLAVPRAEETPALRGVVRAVFDARRKTLRNALGRVYGSARAGRALDTLGLDPQRRGETLAVEQFAALAAQLGAPGESEGDAGDAGDGDAGDGGAGDAR